jgi:hypothetical protein
VLKEYLGMLISLFLAIFDLTGAVSMHFEAPGTLRMEFAGYSEFSRKNGVQPDIMPKDHFSEIQRGC